MASAEAAVGATDEHEATARRLGAAEAAPLARRTIAVRTVSGTDAGSALLAAALALPGILPTAATAQTAPDQGVVAFRYFDYRDWQPGAQRMTVRSPSLYVLKPLSDSLSLEGSLVYDAMSGASVLYHNTLSGASGLGVTDYRTAGDFKVTKYYDRWAVGVGAVISSERDYLSRALSMDVRTWTADKNRTWAFGLAGARDNIDSTNGVAQGRHRETYDFLLGVTQVLNAGALVQSNLTYSDGRGYYSDPYKPGDTRPDTRRVWAWLTRYNQHMPRFDASLRLSYRYLNDSWGADSHMLEAAWAQPLRAGWTVTPALRYITQSAADFYFDPPFGRGFQLGKPYTADTRLSAFGAFTPSVRIGKQFADGWLADLGFSFYRQKASWRIGDGSPGLKEFSARWIELGVQKAF
jgi:hypothetical protein